MAPAGAGEFEWNSTAWDPDRSMKPPNRAPGDNPSATKAPGGPDTAPGPGKPVARSIPKNTVFATGSPDPSEVTDPEIAPVVAANAGFAVADPPSVTDTAIGAPNNPDAWNPAVCAPAGSITYR